MTPIQNTLAHLRLCQKARANGCQVSFTTDPAWLINQAINRRAGWPDDPGRYRGSCMPVARNRNKAKHWDSSHNPCMVITRANGKRIVLPDSLHGRYTETVYPAKAIGEVFNHLRNLARELNTARRVVHAGQLGTWRKLILARMPERIE